MRRMMMALCGALLAATAAQAFEHVRVYTLGDKINGAKLIVLAKVVESRELVAGNKLVEGEIVGDYHYRLQVRELLKGKDRSGEIIVVQSPEYRKDKRFYQQDSLVIAFLVPNTLSGKFRSRYKLAQQQYYENKK